MQAFEFYCPTKIYFGKGAEAKVGEAVKHFGGTKVFIAFAVVLRHLRGGGTDDLIFIGHRSFPLIHWRG